MTKGKNKSKRAAKAEPTPAEKRVASEKFRMERIEGAVEKRNVDLRERFITALKATRSVTASCTAAGVGYTTVYEWREKNEEFRKAWDQARKAAVDDLESSALVRAVTGVARVVLYKGEVVMVDGKPLMQREFETALTIFMLKKLRPDTYADDARKIGDLTPEQFAEKARKAVAAIGGLTVKVEVSPTPVVEGEEVKEAGLDPELREVAEVEAQGKKVRGEKGA